jgi:hypothetical protein
MVLTNDIDLSQPQQGEVMRANKVSRLLIAGLILVGFGASAAAVSANDKTIVAPWMTIGQDDPYLDDYYGYRSFWNARPLSETWPSANHRALRPSSRRVSGPRVPFPGRPSPPEPPFLGGCPPGLDARPIGPPGFVPPPFSPCPASP